MFASGFLQTLGDARDSEPVCIRLDDRCACTRRRRLRERQVIPRQCGEIDFGSA
jgi:hypothetical protein